MIRIVVYYALVLTVVLVAFRRGDHDTRVAALVCLAASVLSSGLMNFNTAIALSVALVDLGVLAFFVTLALRTPRFWPLWVAGLQLTTVLGHGLRLLEPSLLNIAYAAAMRFWGYPILLILLVAALRSDGYRSCDPRLA